MAHTKSGGKTNQKANRAGKRQGLKKFGGQKVHAGEIIIRQTGTCYLASDGANLGKDHTLFATRNGTVKFFTAKGKKFVAVK